MSIGGGTTPSEVNINSVVAEQPSVVGPESAGSEAPMANIEGQLVETVDQQSAAVITANKANKKDLGQLVSVADKLRSESTGTLQELAELTLNTETTASTQHIVEGLEPRLQDVA